MQDITTVYGYPFWKSFALNHLNKTIAEWLHFNNMHNNFFVYVENRTTLCFKSLLRKTFTYF